MKKLIALGFLFVFYHNIYAQINVYYPDVNDWVNKNFSGQGIIIGNIAHKGNSDAIASFKSTPNVLKLTEGLILSTGEAMGAIGPNDRYNLSKDFGSLIEHDKDLKNLVKGDLYDVSLIEFDFVPFNNSIKFNYQFASEEYPEYVSSTFNDIFAFFISDGVNTKNMAVVPGKNYPVSVNTINNQTEPQLFINNNVFINDIGGKDILENNRPKKLTKKIWSDLKNVFTKTGSNSKNEYEPNEELLKTIDKNLYQYLQYDGITQKLTAQSYVEPYKKYHLKIIIADVTDNVYDSAVFLESRSLITTKDTSQILFKNYADYNKIIDPKLILNGKLLEELLPKEIIIPNTNIYFDFNKAEVTAIEMEKIKLIINNYDKLKKYYQLEIIGNTDSIGSYDYNLTLSKARTDIVIKLLKNELPDFKYDIVDYKSYTNPTNSNTSETGRKLNRRVSIKFVRKK